MTGATGSAGKHETTSGTRPAASPARLDREMVWTALDKASFAVLSFVTPSGHPCSSGVVYATAHGRLYVVTAAQSMKARTIGADELVSVTVPVRRGGLLALLFPIPPATISFRARVVVHPPGKVDLRSISKRLHRLVPKGRQDGVVLELIPEGTFVTYGLGVSLRQMVDPTVAGARVPV